MNCTYRIVTNAGTVDFARELNLAQRKYKRYCVDCVAGYSEWVLLVEVDVVTGAEIAIASLRK